MVVNVYSTARKDAASIAFPSQDTALYSRYPPDSLIENGTFREMAELLAAAGVDLLVLEMISDSKLANPAIAAAVA